jgi:succinylarginine dihydrolase
VEPEASGSSGWVEINVDALVGPTHHFAGAGVGNVASREHRYLPSHPRRAALEGLEKAALVAGLGVPQFVLPPPERPRLDWLSALGFGMEDSLRHAAGDAFNDVLEAARRACPLGFAAAYSSAFMWAANSGTYAPACDTLDRRHHLVLANLNSSWHRSLEAGERLEDFQRLFRELAEVAVHPPLPNIMPLRDEGAANHLRLSSPEGSVGLHLFVYGEQERTDAPRPQRFPARQTRAACEAVARQLRLPPERTFFLQQDPRAIDAGAFHNDVIATSHGPLLIQHELAFIDADSELARLEATFQKLCGCPLQRIVVRQCELPLAEAVASYFFNSQILTPAAHGTQPASGSGLPLVLVCARQCQTVASAQALVRRLVADPDNSICDVRFVTLDESMSGGGGPACLRLRVQLPERALSRLAPAYRLTPRLEQRLRTVIMETYPEELDLQRLCDPEVIEGCWQAARRVRGCFELEA